MDDDKELSGFVQHGRVTNSVDNFAQLLVFGLYFVFGFRRATTLARRHGRATVQVDAKTNTNGDGSPRQRLLDAAGEPLLNDAVDTLVADNDCVHGTGEDALSPASLRTHCRALKLTRTPAALRQLVTLADTDMRRLEGARLRGCGAVLASTLGLLSACSLVALVLWAAGDCNGIGCSAVTDSDRADSAALELGTAAVRFAACALAAIVSVAELGLALPHGGAPHCRTFSLVFFWLAALPARLLPFSSHVMDTRVHDRHTGTAPPL